jgi:hypothetical protein
MRNVYNISTGNPQGKIPLGIGLTEIWYEDVDCIELAQNRVL